MIKELNDKVDFKIIDIQKLHFGENKSYLVRTQDDSFILKIYRNNRGFKLSVEDEINLTQKLSELGILTSHYQKFNNGCFVEQIDNQSISLQEIINGYMILDTDSKYYFNLGKELKNFHNKTSTLSGFKALPRYSFDELVEKRYQNIFKADFLNENILSKINYYKSLVQDELADIIKSSSQQFIHFDVHSGNIIFNEKRSYLIDWEESGFGHFLLDLAVPCTHLMKDEFREKKLKSLLDGYELDINLRELNLMTILKFLYLMTHIPSRVDIIKDPEKIFTRYLNYFEFLNNEY